MAVTTPDGRPLRALAELLALCRERGIRTRVITMPEAPTFQRLYPDGLSDRIAKSLEIVANANGSGFLDTRFWLAEDDFYDGHHLFRAGAEAFTRRLTNEAIRPHFDGGGR